MKHSHRLLALVALCAVGTLAFCITSADAAPLYAKAASLHGFDLLTYGAQFALAVGLDNMRVQHSDLLRQASTKIAEVKAGMSETAVAAIEADHRALLANAETVARAISEEEKKPATKSKDWAAGFYASAGNSGLDLAALNEIVQESETHEQAKDRLIDKMAVLHNANKPAGNGARARVGAEATENFVAGVTASIMAKTPELAKDKQAARNEFSGYTLRELARMALDLRGIKIPQDPMLMVGAAMAPVIMQGSLSTSDFVNILANVANKAMLKGYEEAAETFQTWTGTGTLGDFKTAKRVDLGLFPSLAKVQEGAEYTYAKISDRGVDIVLATYGKLFAITRQSIINDDLGAFTKIPSRMGQASKRTIGDLVYALLVTPGNWSDSVAFFHATHKNLQTGAALAASTLNAGRALMKNMPDPDNIKKGLNIRPAYLLVPNALEGTANQLMTSQSEPGQENPAVSNRVANMAQVVAEARLDADSATSWYLAGNPSQYDTIEVSYLNGVQTPTLEQREGWNTDGVEFKVRMDAGVNLLDFRALQKSTQ